jgi:type IV pilus assembly protein PilV
MKNNSGFTLGEVLIALSIFAIGSLAVASLQITSGKSNRSGSEITMAVNLASDQMETFMTLPFDDASLSTDPDANPHSGNLGKYSLQWVVSDTDVNADGIDDAKLINLTVSWAGYLSGGSEPRSVSIDLIKPSI